MFGAPLSALQIETHLIFKRTQEEGITLFILQI